MATVAPMLASSATPHNVTTSPIVTGASILGIKYADGVMLAGDTLGSYGNLARYTDLRRIRRVGDHALIAASGEYSDFQYIMDVLSEKMAEDAASESGVPLSARELHAYLSRVMYGKRNKGDPLYNKLLVAGVTDGVSFLGYLDQYGTPFSEDYAATGLGMAMGLPLIRARWRADLTAAEARTLLEDCLRVLWYRDTRALNKVTAAGVTLDEPYVLSATWDYRSFIKPKADSDTGGSW